MSELLFLGPRGTYSEIGAIKAKEFLKDDYELKPISTISKIIELSNNNENYVAIIPFENSIEGIVRPTVDGIYRSNLKIQAEIDVKIEHCLISKVKDISNIKHIISHPQALAQCAKFITENFDENIDMINATSTAQAVCELSMRDGTFCAIGSSYIAEEKKFNIIEKNIGDIKENLTRFVIISKKDLNLPNKSRSTIVFNTKNESGALLKILQIIYKYKLNLIYLESRPSKKVFGEYDFFADIDNDITNNEQLKSDILKECNHFKFLGSYPLL